MGHLIIKGVNALIIITRSMYMHLTKECKVHEDNDDSERRNKESLS
jgi:hypothetical protein